MCSIIGFCSPDVPMDDFREGFMKTVSRGPDDSYIAAGRRIFSITIRVSRTLRDCGTLPMKRLRSFESSLSDKL